MAIRDMIVRIQGDSRSVERAFDRSSKAASQFNRDVTTTGAKIDSTTKKFSSFAKGTATGFGGALAVTEAITQIKAAVDVASNLQEQISKTNVVFEGSADTVRKWATTTASSIGIANDQALAAASTFGAMFDQAGASSQRAAELSTAVVELAADLASFNNTSTDEALTALRSGLSGEIEPLRRFQVFLTEASVAQQAMEATGKTNAKQLTQGEKILARYNLILEQTGKQQGDFARTTDGLANQQRILSAQVRDLQAKIGGLLVPAMARYVGVITDAVEGTSTLKGALVDLGNVKVPVIEIPIKMVITGLPGLGNIPGEFAKNLLPPQARGAVPFVQAIVDALTPDKIPDVNTAADKFMADTGIGTFMEKLPKEIQKKAVAAFGQKGFKPLPENLAGATDEAAFENLLGSLGLQADMAAVTKTTADDLAVFAQMKTAINARIKVHGRTTELLRLLFEVDEQRRAVIEGAADDAKSAREATLRKIKELAEGRAELLEKAREAEQIRQFRALGLDATGNKPPPAIANLLKQIKQLSTRDLTGQDRGVLARIRKVLVNPLKKATPETRAAAKGLIDGIRSELDIDKKVTGPLTKTTALSANKILSGLGMDRDTERELRARLSKFNSAGRALARPGTTGSFGTSGFVPVVESHVTVNLDGQKIGQAVTKSQTKTSRGTKQKRGPNRRSGI